jgi:hypothetical protein
MFPRMVKNRLRFSHKCRHRYKNMSTVWNILWISFLRKNKTARRLGSTSWLPNKFVFISVGTNLPLTLSFFWPFFIHFSRHKFAFDLCTRKRSHVGRHHGQPDRALLSTCHEGHLQVQYQGQRRNRYQRKQVCCCSSSLFMFWVSYCSCSFYAL